jgi:hypothetical protein
LQDVADVVRHGVEAVTDDRRAGERLAGRPSATGSSGTSAQSAILPLRIVTAFEGL